MHRNNPHTNAYDEVITTPTGESVRRAMAIQLIINRERGLAKHENPNQGAFIIDERTDLVEEAVLVGASQLPLFDGKSIRPRSWRGLPARRNCVCELDPERAHAHHADSNPLRTPGGARSERV